MSSPAGMCACDDSISAAHLPDTAVRRSNQVSSLEFLDRHKAREQEMKQDASKTALAHLAMRRQFILGSALAFSGLAIAADRDGEKPAASSSAAPNQAPAPKPENKSRTSLHQQVDLKASPQRIYGALLD